MNKVLSDLKMLRQLQSVILGYLILLGVMMFVTWVIPDKHVMLNIFTPIFYAGFIVLPFALVVLIFSLQVFKSVALQDPSLKAKVRLAGWSSIIVAAYILMSFTFYGAVSSWAFLINHDLEVAFQSSPQIMGLLLLATHVYVAWFAQKKLKASNAA